MSIGSLPRANASASARAFADLIEELTARLQACDQAGVEALLAEHAEHADEIRRLLPAMQVLADLSADAGTTSSPPCQGGVGGVEGAGLGLAATLGDYQILREVGRGGMGIVYEATQLSLNRRVALKVLPFASTLDSRQLQRFKNEAQAAACLHHTNIVPVFATGVERGVHYYAMQFIEGHTLAEVIETLRNAECPMTNDERMTNDQARMTNKPVQAKETKAELRHSTLDILSSFDIRHSSFFKTVAELGIQAAEALEHAHQMGIVHRDVKPANLIVDVRRNVWVTDFGLAQVQSETTHLTLSGDLLGTLRYMSPEQALGKSRLAGIDHRTDIYSLGVTLYELLTLHPAFDGKDRQEVLRQIAFEEPRPIRSLRLNVPRELETIVLKSMEKEPEGRYTTAGEMAADLRRWLMHEPIRARRASLVQRARKWGRRHRAILQTTATVLFLTLIASSLLLWQERGHTLDALQQAEQNAAEARKHEAAAKQQAAALRRRVYAANMGQAFRHLQRGELDELRTILAQYEPHGGEEELRGFEWHLLQNLARVQLKELVNYRGHRGFVYHATFSPDGKLVASGGEDRDVHLWDAATGQIQRILSGHLNDVDSISFSPDGQTLASASDEGLILLWDLRSVQPPAVLRPFNPMEFADTCLLGTRPTWGPAAAPSNYLASLVLPFHRPPIESVAFSPDGTKLISGGHDRIVRLWDVATRTCVTELRGHTNQIMAVCFAPNGKLVASAGRDNIVYLWDLQDPDKKLRLEHPSQTHALAFSPQGDVLATADMGINLWRTADGTCLHRAPKAPRPPIKGLAITPDGRSLVSCLDSFKVWSLSGELLGRFALHDGIFQSVVVSRDGLFVTAAPHSVKISRLIVRAESQPFRVPERRRRSQFQWDGPGFQFCPDGNTLAVHDSTECILLWDLQAKQRRGSLQFPAGHCQRFAFSPDGQDLAMAATDGSVWLRNLASGSTALILAAPPKLVGWVSPLTISPQWVSGLAFTPDGRQLVALYSNGAFRQWSRDDRREQSRFLRTYSGLLAAPDSKRLLFFGPLGRPQLWDVENGNWCGELIQPGTSVTPAFSPDGHLLALGGEQVRLVALTSGRVIMDWPEHAGLTTSVAFAPDGRTVASGGEDGTVRLWHVSTRSSLFTLAEGLGPVQELHFSPNGHHLAAVHHTPDGLQECLVWSIRHEGEVESRR